MTLLSEFSTALAIVKNESRYFISLTIAVACILLIPLVGMQFTDEVNWRLSDFAAAWVLLFGSGFLYRLVSRRVNNFRFRAAVGLAVGTSLFITWANLAVGIIGNENNPANGLFFGVILVGFAGAVMSRFRPEGLAVTMFAMAFAQFLVPVVALMIWTPEIDFGVVKIIIFNGFFVMLYIVSALLFRNASRSNGDASST